MNETHRRLVQLFNQLNLEQIKRLNSIQSRCKKIELYHISPGLILHGDHADKSLVALELKNTFRGIRTRFVWRFGHGGIVGSRIISGSCCCAIKVSVWMDAREWFIAFRCWASLWMVEVRTIRRQLQIDSRIVKQWLGSSAHSCFTVASIHRPVRESCTIGRQATAIVEIEDPLPVQPPKKLNLN
jgi:hypothetical protein